MNQSPARILVSVDDREVRLRIAGRANFSCGPDFKKLIAGLQEKGYSRFVIEMGECALMDSTFLGLLCGLALRLKENGNGATVELLNSSPRVAELLESLGATEIFKLRSDSTATPKPAETAALCSTEHTRAEMAETSLEAHQNLMALSPENAAKFKDVAQFLAEDLERLKAAGS
jgi:anti-sigma B factor antagonist